MYICACISVCVQVRIRCLKCYWFPASLPLFLGTACQDDDSHLFQQSSKCHFLWISQIAPKVERQHLQIAVQRIYCFCYSLHSDKCIIQVHSFQLTSHSMLYWRFTLCSIRLMSDWLGWGVPHNCHPFLEPFLISFNFHIYFLDPEEACRV